LSTQGFARDTQRFATLLAFVAVAGLVVRLVYVLIERKDITFVADAYCYHAGANLLVDGKGFISPYAYAGAARWRRPITHRCTSCSSPFRRFFDDQRADTSGVIEHARHRSDRSRGMLGMSDLRRASE